MKAADRVATLAMDLQLDMQCNGGRAAIKTVLNQRESKAMLEKLDRSKLDLQFAYTMFADACRRQDYEAIKTYMAELRDQRYQILCSTTAVSQLQDSTNGEDESSDRTLARSRRTKSSESQVGTILLGSVSHCGFAGTLGILRLHVPVVNGLSLSRHSD
jgi:hypothetical protein